ncbi:DUF542 domain-containing protein [Tenacibaculum maritimum]|uniref:DUF542 domain-containing protein n=1 Tax=Tenacibaculum maritimum TaxID=107401 RepID=UPI001E4B6F39|nr:DUF542 domain-containing protein [Tenacibaculum maritimum]MCD9583462.1 DUF542 domain-containing protein [Tenacibaculum maritimum]MCD9620289.1 DUF542 domain-containing protein [Tenacibaculum maritimum]MCD9627087.1 DUF542 domain-containing protein [Tenacibaculum maritimum]MCD9631277.1 DUF542 domain-containing protein [Tenacibaculum maritimum]MCD9633112.1 DUF542 domain-containing protein [Tenacibaculum maritimum]
MDVLMKRTVADYVTENIKTAHIFNKYGIHFCCKGEVTIQEACSERNINVMDLEKELLTVDRVSDLIEDYNKWELNFLMIYLKNVHHVCLRENLHLLSQAIAEILETPQPFHRELKAIGKQFELMKIRLSKIIGEEEEVLFPLIKELVALKKEKHLFYDKNLLRKKQKLLKKNRYVRIVIAFEAITKWCEEHEAVKVCKKLSALCLKLQDMEYDLYEHIHLKNNILYKKVRSLQEEILFELHY